MPKEKIPIMLKGGFEEKKIGYIKILDKKIEKLITMKIFKFQPKFIMSNGSLKLSEISLIMAKPFF
jgi:hypothetical protein